MVQLVDDLLGRYPLGKLCQDAANDLGFALIDDERAFDLVASFISGDDIAVRTSAGAFPRCDVARQAAVGL
ncbi:hypothetical protein A3753_12900 [Sulfitobacter sp. HI0082]|nr:hypothetical protein A3753_12900 [Sulfitobacter sp. HI0082]